MKSFSLLGREVRDSLSELGFKKPTEAQEMAIPEILSGKNVLLIAPTGIGKTEAAVLPVFDKFLGRRPDGISILYITPLRALNRDMLDRLEWWSKKLGINISVRHGDTTQHMRRKQALAPPDMLITTPETLQAVLPGAVMKKHLRNVRWVIVDEIHELAEDKRGAQLSVGLERLSELTGRSFQRIGLSATIGSVKRVARFLAGRHDMKVLKVSTSKNMELNVERVKPCKEDKVTAGRVFAGIDASARLRRMAELFRSYRSTLIFVNTREMAEVLASRFRTMGENVGIHHSSLSQEVRIATEEDFKKQKLKALICTSSLELGIDVGSVDLVIQYSSPRQVTRLLQRIGRSGHAVGRKSRGVIVATDPDDILESLVIARRAYDEKPEEVEVEENPYDVLAHQLVGLALDFGKISKKRAFEIVRRSFVFSKLTFEEFEEVLSFMSRLRLIWVEKEAYRKRRSSWTYYYENLSTIPDERRYFAKNFVTQENVGILDEAFVANYVEPMNLIIFKGRPWRVISVEEERILLEPVDDISGAIPSWIGEEIPVPFLVARDVGKIRRAAGSLGSRALKEMHADSYTKKLAISKIKRQKREGITIPDERRILVELFQNFAVIHSCNGMKVNQTIGRVFSILLSSKLGHSVALQTDAYRVILHSPFDISREQIDELFNISFELIGPLLSKTLERTSLFRWKFIHVAKRFGAISRSASYTKGSIAKIIETYDNTPLYRETLKEIFKSNLDVENAERIFKDISAGRIKIEILELEKPSPIAELGMKAYEEIILPERAERMILKALQKRIANKRIELFCLYCARWFSSFRVKNIQEDIKCKNCGARMLAVLKGRQNEFKKLYRRFKSGKKMSRNEKREVKKMQVSANLVLSYGRDAIAVQAGHGIGPEAAKRILLATVDRDELYRNILKAERDYARTRMFWD